LDGSLVIDLMCRVAGTAPIRARSSWTFRHHRFGILSNCDAPAMARESSLELSTGGIRK
jgi:hypothetical protein